MWTVSQSPHSMGCLLGLGRGRATPLCYQPHLTQYQYQYHLFLLCYGSLPLMTTWIYVLCLYCVRDNLRTAPCSSCLVECGTIRRSQNLKFLCTPSIIILVFRNRERWWGGEYILPMIKTFRVMSNMTLDRHMTLSRREAKACTVCGLLLKSYVRALYSCSPRISNEAQPLHEPLSSKVCGNKCQRSALSLTILTYLVKWFSGSLSPMQCCISCSVSGMMLMTVLTSRQTWRCDQTPCHWMTITQITLKTVPSFLLLFILWSTFVLTFSFRVIISSTASSLSRHPSRAWVWGIGFSVGAASKRLYVIRCCHQSSVGLYVGWNIPHKSYRLCFVRFICVHPRLQV